MANFIRNLQKRYRRQKNREQQEWEEELRGDPISYEQRMARYRFRRSRRIGIALIVLLLIAAAMYFFVVKRTYRNYKIIRTSEQEDIVSTHYVEMDGKILRYSPDGVSLVTDKLDTVWSETYTMQSPVADVRGTHAVIADKDGTTIKIFNKNGLTGTATTSYRIVKARISNNGLVAAILDGGDDTWINFYGSDGSLIAENQTKIDEPGYPMDVTISNDGIIMMVTFQMVDGGETTSYVAFYNFGDVGQNEDDRIVSGFTYPGIVIPQIRYLGGNTSAAIREDGFTLYEGKQIPDEVRTVEVDQEIVSTFCDDSTIGLVFKNNDKEKIYAMEVYTTSGKLKFKKAFNIPYTSIRMSDGYILMHNSSQMCVMNGEGTEKFSGSVDGTIHDFFRLGWNTYLLVLDSGIHVIRLT